MASKKKTRKYGRSVGKTVKKVMHERKAGTLRSGRSKKKVKSRQQAVAIALSEARAAGEKVPPRRTAKKAGKKSAKKATKKTRQSSAKKTAKKTSKTSAKKRSSQRASQRAA